MAEKPERTVTDETEVSTTELAMVIGVTARRIQQLTQDGTLNTEKRGRYLLADNVQRYITYLGGTGMSEEEKKMETNRKKAEVTIKAAKATIAKLEAEEVRGTMHRSDDVAAITEELVTTIRGLLLALPGRLAVDVANAADAADAAIIIRNGVYDIMNELSHFHYDPAKYEDRVRERRDWDSSKEDEADA